MVVVLWPYEWKVMGSNLVEHKDKEGFIFANSSLKWS